MVEFGHEVIEGGEQTNSPFIAKSNGLSYPHGYQ